MLAKELSEEVETQPLDQALMEWLVKNGHIKQEDLARALKVKDVQNNQDHLPGFLIKLGLASDVTVAEGLSAISGYPLIKLSEYPELIERGEYLSFRFLKEHHLLPLSEDDGRIDLVMAYPGDDFAIRAIEMASGKVVRPFLGIQSEVDDAVEELYGEGKSQMGKILEEVDGSEAANDTDIEHLKDLASEAPVVRLVNFLLNKAIEMKASDIHIECFEARIRVRYRVDGVLQDMESPASNLKDAIVSRIKIMANLDIAERRLPQDGRIKLKIHGKDSDLRVSTIPTLYGESVVMRLLIKDDNVLQLSELGFEERDIPRFNEVFSVPHGMILVTGPTGSGKSTTLYTALHSLNTGERKIITVEDPVEYQVEGVNQIQVKPSIGLTFASALRSIVRQDPDVIMVGELRDLETSKICVQSALTGHLVLSTLHTNDAASSVTRLLEMGIEDFLLTSTLRAIVAQRLVRVLCPECRESYTPSADEIREYDLDKLVEKGAGIKLYRAKGCRQCHDTGYKGRVVIGELLVLNDAVRSKILERADAGALRKVAYESGMTSMYENGCRKALQGVTTIDEVMRVYDGGE
ncbi:MAG: type II secretion system protein GspE [Gammaproteobacteria bacterium]|nr:type II secretion system protein GspE [Gammaproteobacteria bacterium]